MATRRSQPSIRPVFRCIAAVTVAVGLLVCALPVEASASVADARLKLEAGDRAGALEALRQLTGGRAAESAEALSLLMRTTLDGAEALRAAERLVDRFSGRPEAAIALEFIGHHQAAVGAYRSAAKTFAQLAEQQSGADRLAARLFEARALLGGGRARAALEVFQGAEATATTQTERAEGVLGMADCALELGQLSVARQHYDAYLVAFPESPWRPVALSQLARVLELEGDAEGARAIYAQLTTEAPGAREAAGARGALRQRQRSGVSDAPPEPSGPERLQGAFTLQVGAFGTEDNARALVRELSDQGVADARIERETRRDGKEFFRVRIGAFASAADAARAGRALRRAHHLTYQVVTR